MRMADIGVIGLAVMGENLIMNMEDKGLTVAVHNRSTEKLTRFEETRACGKNIICAETLEALVQPLKKPRIVMMMVKAGKPVDELIERLIPLLEAGDILIDGGNSNFRDTVRRVKKVESAGLYYVGTGVSGGEEGALLGPSIMPGGSPEAWPHIKPIFEKIAAKLEDGSTCCAWMGKGGAGHFVKMVHNGIEYGDMQLISESYHIMKALLKMSADEMSKVFEVWNDADLNSYLIEITAEILAFRDEKGNHVLEYILDRAGQKGTGKWVGITAFEEGVPVTLIAEAVFARCLSAIKEERIEASSVLSGPENHFDGDRNKVLRDLSDALYAAKIISYAQGFALMRSVSDTYDWELNFGDIAQIWRGGCIIRSQFLTHIKAAYERMSGLSNLVLDPYFSKILEQSQSGWRDIVGLAISHGIPVPAMASGLCYFDGYRSAWLPSNMIQAQRDYFGAHTYERTDRLIGEYFHTDWTGEGGQTSASTYTV